MTETPFPDLRPHHVAISVRDLDEAIAFWRDLFGFVLDFRTEIAPIGARLAFIRRDGFRLELFEVAHSVETPAERRMPNTDLMTQGAKHLCFSVEDPQQALEMLHERGVGIVGVMRAHGLPMQIEEDPRLTPGDARPPARAFFFLDPSGVLVEILRRADFED